MKSKALFRLQKNLELAFPLAIAVFAAVLSINDLFAGRFGSDELQLSNSRNNAYQWYQAKGIKETMLEGQLELLESLLLSGAIDKTKIPAVEDVVVDSKQRIVRYKQEKKEILIGSKALPKDKWVQDIDGEMGKVVGAKEYDTYLIDLGRAGDSFDIASMLLQICLVIGAIGMIVHRESMKIAFFRITLSAGLIGSLFFSQALWLANQIPY
ncbi:MAG: DUF4337 family protein [Proteobacteria bacterium]|nr:MAG: DUF4337 family protein [Pseudomonadota bacterium]